MDDPSDLPLKDLLKPLSLADMETLLAALDPRLEGFGEGPSCLDDARAFLARLASGDHDGDLDTATMEEWIETWRAAGGNRQTLRLMVQTLMAERSAPPETLQEWTGDEGARDGEGQADAM